MKDYTEGINKPYIHISMDDVICVLEDITRNKFKSIFCQTTLAFLKKMHDEYGIVVSLYCFYKYEGIPLSEITDSYKQEFSDNSDWLKVGFHGFDENIQYLECGFEKAKNDYSLTVEQLLRITGTSECIDIVPRIHYFSGSKESLLGMAGAMNGIRGVLGADDERQNYYLNETENYILKNDGIFIDSSSDLVFLKTDIRTELIDDMNHFLELNKHSLCRKNSIIIFTHEWAMNNDNEKKLEKIIKWGIKNGFVFDFPMYRMDKKWIS